MDQNEIDLTANSYLDSVSVIVEKENSGSGNFLRLHHRLQVGQQAHVFRHISGQNLKKIFKVKSDSFNQIIDLVFDNMFRTKK